MRQAMTGRSLRGSDYITLHTLLPAPVLFLEWQYNNNDLCCVSSGQYCHNNSQEPQDFKLE